MNSKLIKILRIILLPISFIYGCIVTFRNWLYRIHFFKSYQPTVPTICVGNISVGGTGKSPMVIYIAQLLKSKFQVAVLSRGYKRSTKGLLFYNAQITPTQIGEEPFMIANAIPFAQVAVHENRVAGVQAIVQQHPSINCIVLDDAFQHRKIVALVNVILVDFNHPFFNDYYLPTGNLRDAKSRIQDATIVVVTKCAKQLSETEALNFKAKMKLKPTIPVFFTTIQYHTPKAIFNHNHLQFNAAQHILLVTAIANPTPLYQYLIEKVNSVEKMEFPDHHHFTQQNITNIIAKAKAKNAFVITTDKDAVKLKSFNQLAHTEIYSLPITIQFKFNQQTEFEEKITAAIVHA